MVSIDLADELTFDPAGRRARDRGRRGSGSVAVGPGQPGRAGRSRRSGGARGGPPGEAHPGRRRARRRLGRRRRRPALGRVLGPRRGGRARRRRPVLCARADGPACRGSGSGSSPWPFEPRSFVLLVPPLAVDTAAAYRAWDDLPRSARHAGRRRGEQRPRGGGARGRARAGALARPLGELTGRAPRLAGSGATWFVEGDAEALGPRRGRGRSRWRVESRPGDPGPDDAGATVPAVGRRRRVLLARPPLPARRLQHLLVLLLAHALAALLDEGSHAVRQASSRRGRSPMACRALSLTAPHPPRAWSAAPTERMTRPAGCARAALSVAGTPPRPVGLPGRVLRACRGPDRRPGDGVAGQVLEDRIDDEPMRLQAPSARRAAPAATIAPRGRSRAVPSTGRAVGANHVQAAGEQAVVERAVEGRPRSGSTCAGRGHRQHPAAGARRGGARRRRRGSAARPAAAAAPRRVTESRVDHDSERPARSGAGSRPGGGGPGPA